MTVGALTGIDVAVEIGFGSPPGAASPTWTDVSAYIAWDQSPIRIEPGRTAERDRLAARRLSLVLDNDPVAPGLTKRRFDPRNTSGPYYGQLRPRTPIRVRVTHNSATRTIFRGFIDGGWPQDWSGQFQRFVPIEAVDAAAYAAQTPAPTTAFDVAVRSLINSGPAPRFWLRAGPNGWTDAMSGRTVNANMAMVTSDPLVDGDPESFSTTGRDGRALHTTPELFVVPTATTTGAVYGTGTYGTSTYGVSANGTELLFTCWVRLNDPEDGNGHWLWREVDNNGNATFSLFIGPNVVTFRVANGWGELIEGGTVTGDAGSSIPAILGDGRSHHVALWVKLPASGPVAGTARLWVDAVEAQIGWTDTATARGNSTVAAIGGDPLASQLTTNLNLFGAVDHIVLFWGVAGVDVHQLVTDLHDAGRIARAGDRMDQRFTWLLNAIGWNHIGPVDASGIATQKGYRPVGSPLDLLQAVEDTEQGRVFVDNDGAFRFAQRSWAWDDPVSKTVQATFSDEPADLDGTGLPFLAEASRIVDDDRRLVNVAKVNRVDGREQVVEDTASIAVHGRRQPVDLNNLLFASDRQSRSVAEWIVLVNKDTNPRVEELAVSVMNRPTDLAPFASEVSPGWLVRVKRGGVQIDGHVTSVGHEIAMDRWIVRLLLDGTRVGRSWFRWGTSTWNGADGWAF